MVEITAVGDELTIDGGDPLVCATEHPTCCRTFRAGQWYYPNRTMVTINGNGYSFYRTRRDAIQPVAVSNVFGGVLLHRRFDATIPNGIFYCALPSSDGTDQTIYVGLYSTTVNGKYSSEYDVVARRFQSSYVYTY